MKSMRLLVLSIATIFVASSAYAGGGILSLELNTTISVANPGDQVDVTVDLNSSASSGVFGWSYAVQHDPAQVTLDMVEQGDIDSVFPAPGFPAAFEEVTAISNATGDGFLNATILSLTETFFFPAGASAVLGRATYTVVSQNDGEALNIAVVDGVLANLPSPPVAIGISLVGGVVIEVGPDLDLAAVNVQVEVPPPFQFSASNESVIAILGQDAVEATATISIEQVAPFMGNSSQDFDAFSMGVQHDPMQVEALSVNAVAGTTDAASVAFFGSSILADGFVLGVVAETDPASPFAPLNAGSAIDVAEVVYGPAAGAMPVGGEIYSSALTFVDGLTSSGGMMGSLPVINEVAIDDGGSALIAAVVTVDGSVSIEARSTIDFIRGDCNDDGLLNIADGITILQNIVASATAPTALDCVAACDADGMTPMGGMNPVSLNDALLVLAYTLGLDPSDLSVSAPGAAVLPDPGPNCGQFMGQQPEDCEDYSSCP